MKYGKVDFDYALAMGSREPANDGPIYMVNWMKYHEVAQYEGAGGPQISGKEADNRYAPFEVLEKIGAMPVYIGDVVAQSCPGEWDRMAIVRYATRKSFIDMQSRTDFKEKHVHKEAGMLYTICQGCLPDGDHVEIPRRRYVRFELTATEQPGGASPDRARLRVEGTVLGDGRVWSVLTMSWSDEIGDVPSIERGADRMVLVAETQTDRLGKALSGQLT
jgi:hypothetical protein